MIQNRIFDRQTNDSKDDSKSNIWQTDDWCRWIFHRIFDRQMNDAENIWWNIPCIIHLFVKYSILNHSSFYQIFDSESSVCLSDIQSCIICLSVRYSILNYLPVCQIFDSELPACLPDIRFWITCLSVRYSVLNHRPACQIFDSESSACTENTVLFLPENASRIQCFFAWKCIENSVLFCSESAMLLRAHFVIFDNYLKLSKRINERRSLKRKLIKRN